MYIGPSQQAAGRRSEDRRTYSTNQPQVWPFLLVRARCADQERRMDRNDQNEFEKTITPPQRRAEQGRRLDEAWDAIVVTSWHVHQFCARRGSHALIIARAISRDGREHVKARLRSKTINDETKRRDEVRCVVSIPHFVGRNPQSAVVRTAEGRRWVRAYACMRFKPKRGRFGCFAYVVGVCACTHCCI
jgi:hypothetical protein